MSSEDILDVWTPHSSLQVDQYFKNKVARMWHISTFSETQTELPQWCDVQYAWEKNLTAIAEDKFTPSIIKTRVSIILKVDKAEEALQRASFLSSKQNVRAGNIKATTEESVKKVKIAIIKTDKLAEYASQMYRERGERTSHKQDKRKKKGVDTSPSLAVPSSPTAPPPSSPSSSSSSSRPAAAASSSSSLPPWEEEIKGLQNKILDYHVHNTMVHVDMRKECVHAMVEVVIESGLKLDPELDKVLHNFYMARDLSTLKAMLVDVSNIYLLGDREMIYIWHMLENLSSLWVDGIGDQPWEGWFNVHLFGPMLEIVRRIPGITEVTTECHSLGALYLRSQRLDIDKKHDFIMRYKDLGIDLLITEGKPGAKKDDQRDDAEKIRVAMGANLLHLISQVPLGKKERIRELKTFGMLMSCTKVYLMEGRVVGDHLILIYVISAVEIPMDILSLGKALDMLKQLINFSRRIESQISMIHDVLAPIREEPSYSHLDAIVCI
ncbi:hypothetical protein BGX20_007386 [Mortierella sp. AD010]|nr:hypothetical protein BGX20_007386 [Mortierella sp. AD010]